MISFGGTDRKRMLHLLMSLLMLFLAAAFFTACGKSDDGDETEKNAVEGQKEYQDGIAAYEHQDYKAALKHFTKAAEYDNTDAMLMKSICLYSGKGTERDQQAGLRLTKRAADAGNPNAQAFYGHILTHTSRMSPEEKKKGVDYLEKSIAQGCVFAMYTLGTYYGLNDDWDNEVKYLKMAAELPLSTGTEKTFWDYYKNAWDNPSREEKDFSGVNYYIVLSQNTLGIFYEDKMKDIDEARKWYRMAADNGYGSAQEELDYLDGKE